MPTEIVVPRLGWSMDEGLFRGWLKPDGAAVSAGDPLFAIETDKAVQEIEALDSGTLRTAPDVPRDGAVVAVGRVIGWLMQAGESESVAQPHRTDPPAASAASSAPAASRQNAGRRAPRATPRARRIAAALGADLAQIRGGGRDGRIRERDVRAAVAAAKPRA
jgi:pyruvate dehydrogenase E2 component (dihydrolipoamide acetyltransferase)